MRAAARADNQERWWGRERIWALVITSVLNALALYGLTRLVPFPEAETEAENAAMQLVILVPLPVSLPKPATNKPLPIAPKPRMKTASTPSMGGNDRDAPATSGIVQVQDIQQARVAEPELPSPALTMQADDAWDRPIRTAASGLTFQRDLLRSAPNPFASAQPGRFRMRKQLTPQEVVRGISQLLGFWPPGYTDDPCGGIRRSVEMLSGSADHASHRQLVEAIKAKQKYCQ